MKIVIVTGGFDPVHSGHINYIKEAAKLGDLLIVGLNSDAWLTRKKGAPFMPWSERAAVLMNMQQVSRVEAFDDSDGSACALLTELRKQYTYAEIIFANGGDRTPDNIPEMTVEGVKFVFGVGGFNKTNSSSWILHEWKTPKTPRPWGYYRVLHEVPGTKVKELTVMPGQQLSMQRHFERAEYWHVTSGQAVVHCQTESGHKLSPVVLKTHDNYKICVNDWHQLSNPYDEPVKIVEIQYGADCREEDIERR